MWLQDYIGIGTRIERADNPRHTGRVDAVFNTASNAPADTAMYRVTWDNGWREDCNRNDIRREQ